MARFAAVAAANPLATRRQGYSAEQLVTVDPENRWIGYPYPRLMNAHAYNDQSAALVMTSVAAARELGIPPEKWVFLHGCADAHDAWFVSERQNFHSSPAIRAASRLALAMAGKTLDDIALFDLYSCFASAVQIGCAEIGLAEDDLRGLTVTGGLPYFGGPGNNYVTHSIAEMMRQLRARPGAFGLVTANGNYVTKHSFGVYSTTPPAGAWRREHPAVLQARDRRTAQAAVHRDAARRGQDRDLYRDARPRRTRVRRRLRPARRHRRALHRQPARRPGRAGELQSRDSLGRPGQVMHTAGRNVFVPG